MTGHAELARLRKQLDATFERIKQLSVSSSDLEIQSDFARYLCILVSGYLEKALVEVVLEHARRNGGTTLQRFVEMRTRQFANPNCQRILELTGSFDADWRTDLESFLKDDVKDAIDSVVALRNRIAHGTPVSITYQRVRDYYVRVQVAIDHIVGICGVT
jgi:hypothetical protein